MSGPIVRTGATPEFWNNWDNVFGKKTKSASKVEQKAPVAASAKQPASKKKTATAKPAPSAAKKTAAKKAPAKTARKK